MSNWHKWWQPAQSNEMTRKFLKRRENKGAKYMNAKKLISGISALMISITILSSCGSWKPENTVHSIADLNGKVIGVQIGTTGDTLFRINFNDISPVLLNCNVCACAAAGPDTSVTTDTFLVRSDQSHNTVFLRNFECLSTQKPNP